MRLSKVEVPEFREPHEMCQPDVGYPSAVRGMEIEEARFIPFRCTNAGLKQAS